jgi:transcriptional regulator GlxA family with amidase domain
MTFSDYVKNIRIRHAVFLIEQGVRVVKNVALLSGFSDPLYFSGCFRKIVGMSPTEYIAKQTADAEPVPEQILPEPAGVNSPEYCNKRK